MKMKLLLPLAVVLGLAACGQGSSGSTAGEWVAVSGVTDGAEVELIDGRGITLSIDGDQVSGNAACNGYQGEVDVSGDAFSVTELAWTEIGCEPAVHEFEQAYLAALGDFTTYTLADDTLTLTSDDDDWTFERLEPVDD